MNAQNPTEIARVASRHCERCLDESKGLGSSRVCVCGPTVPCGWCGQGRTPISPEEVQP